MTYRSEGGGGAMNVFTMDGTQDLDMLADFLTDQGYSFTENRYLLKTIMACCFREVLRCAAILPRERQPDEIFCALHGIVDAAETDGTI
jgi:hypothetical protein